MLLYALASIAVIYAVAEFANTKQKRKVCPICAATSLTWLWLLAAYLLGYHFDMLLIGILMGGSVVGIMYVLERTFWSHVFAVFGFLAVYFLVQESWLWFALSFAAAAMLGLWQKPKKTPSSPAPMRSDKAAIEAEIKKLEKELEQCCP